MDTLSKAKFFSVLMDGSTDKGNIDDEMFLVTHCDIDGLDERVHTRMDFLCVRRPASVTATGLLSCLEGALQCLGIETLKECKKKMLVLALMVLVLILELLLV